MQRQNTISTALNRCFLQEPLASAIPLTTFHQFQ